MGLEPNEQAMEVATSETLVLPELPANYTIEEEVIEDNRLGQLLLRARLITHDQLHQCLDEQLRSPGGYLGDRLVDMGFVDHDDIRLTLKMQLSELRLGQILVRTSRISREQLSLALTEQENSGELLGSVLIGFGFCGPEDVEWALEQQAEED